MYTHVLHSHQTPRARGKKCLPACAIPEQGPGCAPDSDLLLVVMVVWGMLQHIWH